MASALICHVPIKERLPLVSPIGADRVDPDCDSLRGAAQEANRAHLRVPRVDLRGRPSSPSLRESQQPVELESVSVSVTAGSLISRSLGPFEFTVKDSRSKSWTRTLDMDLPAESA